MIRLPNITAATDSGQLQQIKTYLYQLVQELNWALDALEKNQSKEDANGKQ